MLILSKFKDYYDTAIGYGGIDKSIVYKRKEIEIKPKLYTEDYNKYAKFILDTFINETMFEYMYRSNRNKFTTSYYMLLICGEVYPCIQIHIVNKPASHDRFFYDYDSVVEFIKRRFYKSIYKDKYDKNGKRFFSKIENFFNINNFNKLKLIDYHRNVDSPVIVYDMHYKIIIINDQLKKYDFYKVIDAFQMYQKLEMFLSGVMGRNDKEIIEIDDKSLRDKKGFNDMSFKKEKEK